MEVQRISKNLAQQFFEKYEHLGNCGLGVWHYGLYCNGTLVSVVSYGTVNFDTKRSILGDIANKHGIRAIQLARGGTQFDAPINIPSIIIKMSLRMIRQELGDSLIVAYSDTYWNEIGTIYQASNFKYLGITKPGGQANYLINGRKQSGWTVRKKYGTRSIEKLHGLGVTSVKKIPLTPKHIYVFINASPLKKKFIMRDLSTNMHNYPKRCDLNVKSMKEIHNKMKEVSIKSLDLIATSDETYAEQPYGETFW